MPSGLVLCVRAFVSAAMRFDRVRVECVCVCGERWELEEMTRETDRLSPADTELMKRSGPTTLWLYQQRAEEKAIYKRREGEREMGTYRKT